MPGIEFMYRGELLKASLQTRDDQVILQLQNSSHTYRRVVLRADKQLLVNSEEQLRCRAIRHKDRIWVWVNGHTFEFTVPSDDSVHGGASHGATGDARAPMPGTIIKLMVAAGDTVEAGQVLAILEAMKMEHQIRAPRAGTITHVHGSVGDILDAGALVVSLAEE